MEGASQAKERRRAPSPPTMSSLRRLTRPPRCLKRDRSEYDSEQSEEDHSSPLSVSPGLPHSPWSSSSFNDDGCSDRPRTNIMGGKGEVEGPREAKRSRVRAVVSGESVGRGGEGGDGLGPVSSKRGPPPARPPLSRSNKIGINHMDLLYETKEDKMVCRMCRYVNSPSTLFPLTQPFFFSFFFPFHEQDTQHQRQTDPGPQIPRNVFSKRELG